MSELQTREQSEFNMAVSYLNRLNALFYLADQSAIDLNTHSWFHSLCAIFRELSTELKEEEKKKAKETIQRINTKLSKGNDPMRGIHPDLYMELHDFEVYLRGILKEAGLQNKKVDDAMRALK